MSCLISHPLIRFPLFGDLKGQKNPGVFPLNLKVSKSGCIMYANSTGETLSPCWTLCCSWCGLLYFRIAHFLDYSD